MHRFASCATLILAACAHSAAAQTVVSSFETGIDGWTSADNGSEAPEWIAPSGADDGYAKLLDASTGWGYFKAPSQFSAVAARYGGTFSFDLRHDVQGDAVAYRVRVGITSGSLNLINESVLPTGTWTNYSFTLDALSGWRTFTSLSQNYNSSAPLATEAQMQQALANIDGLYIAADYTPGYAPADIDWTSIDNVVLDVVPAPGAASLGLIALGALHRRRR